MPETLFSPPGATARLSEDCVYRYELARRWQDGPRACWIMLNPSTADATMDDPTIRRCIAFSRAWRYGALVVVNLYAYRATHPDELSVVGDPVGPENDDAIHDAVVRSRGVFAAWGAWRGLSDHRQFEVLELARSVGRRLSCLGLTGQGQPRHPLYVAGDTQPVPYDGLALALRLADRYSIALDQIRDLDETPRGSPQLRTVRRIAREARER